MKNFQDIMQFIQSIGKYIQWFNICNNSYRLTTFQNNILMAFWIDADIGYQKEIFLRELPICSHQQNYMYLLTLVL